MVTPTATEQVRLNVANHIAAAGTNPTAVADATGIPRTRLLNRLKGTYDFSIRDLDLIAQHLQLASINELTQVNR